MPEKGATTPPGGSLYVTLMVIAPIRITNNPKNFSAIAKPIGFSSLMLAPPKLTFTFHRFILSYSSNVWQVEIIYYRHKKKREVIVSFSCVWRRQL
ncbi:MAG: hypothetical protein ACUVRA_02295 [Candidatus Bathyarchaeaceae archaeon]